ncbi:tyrosine-protein phosphatase [Streptomyces sp. enrichment culture]|uniref:tyrosine-protein phosphatase n=1 Tax=Streptomyces sp. enrichment culture TaxID=1795815 RepID=UPI003F558C84
MLSRRGLLTASAAVFTAPLLTGHASAVTSGSRLLDIPGLVNARDIGGYYSPAGSTRYGSVYRTDGLHALQQSGVDALAGLGLAAVIDLRTSLERSQDGPDRLPPGPVSHHCPVGEGSWYADVRQSISTRDYARQEALLGNGRAARLMTDMYRGYVTSSSNRAALARAFTVCATAPGPVLAHCTAGKDRTGVAMAVILRCCGVSSTTVMADYLLSNDLRATADAGTRAYLKAHGYMTDPDLLIPVQRVEAAYLDAFWQQATDSYGSFGKFLTVGLALPIGTLAAMVDRLT